MIEALACQTDLRLFCKASQYDHDVISDVRAGCKVERLADSHCSSLRHSRVSQRANQKPRQHSYVSDGIYELSRTATDRQTDTHRDKHTCRETDRQRQTGDKTSNAVY